MTTVGQPIGRSTVEISRVLSQRWWGIALLACIGVLAAVAGSIALPTQYSASITLIVQETETTDDPETLVRTVQALITSDVAVSDIAQSSNFELTARELKQRLVVERPPGSAVVEVSVVDASPIRARKIAALVLPALNERLSNVRASVDDPTELAVQSFGGSTPQLEQVEVPIIRNCLIGGVAAGALGAVVALVVPFPFRRRRQGRGKHPDSRP